MFKNTELKGYIDALILELNEKFSLAIMFKLSPMIEDYNGFSRCRFKLSRDDSNVFMLIPSS